MASLDDFRVQIDDLDRQIVLALAQRLSVCRKVAHFKKANGVPMMQPERVEAVKTKNAAIGAAAGLSETFVRQLYSVIIDEACRLESDLMA